MMSIRKNVLTAAVTGVLLVGAMGSVAMAGETDGTASRVSWCGTNEIDSHAAGCQDRETCDGITCHIPDTTNSSNSVNDVQEVCHTNDCADQNDCESQNRCADVVHESHNMRGHHGESHGSHHQR